MYQNIYIDTTDNHTTVYVFDDKLGMRTLEWTDFNYAYCRDPSGQHMTMTGVPVSKTRKFTRNNPNVFESDLPRETRVLTDLYLNDDEPSEGTVALFFDIEVSMEEGLPDTDKAENIVTSIALYDPILKRYTVIVLDTANLYESAPTDAADLIFCATEIELLHKFVEVYESIQPTIISGWNSDGFDVPYLFNRLKRVCGSRIANRLSPIGKVKYSDRLERYKIAGVSSLDYLKLYKKFTYTELPNYRLDTVGRTELGMGKIEYEGSLDNLFRTDLPKFIEYNLRDVQILVLLEEKMKLFDIARGICHLGHVPYEDYNMNSRWLEGTIVTYLHRKGIIVTDKAADGAARMKEIDESGEEGFVGAYVREPVPGLYDWVYSLDLQSLYPSILMSLNISPETKVGRVLNFDMEEHLRKEIIAYVVQETGSQMTVEMEYDAFTEFLEENALTIASNGILYTTSKKGIIPEILEEWFEKRVEYKNLMKLAVNEENHAKATYYDRRQHIQKIFLNSLYGYLGLPVARFYDVENAEAVTLTGQTIVKYTLKYMDGKYKKHLADIPVDFWERLDTHI